MNLEARKLSFIQEFLKVQSEETISHLESILRKEKKDTFHTISIEKLNQRIDQSLDDAKNKKITEVNDLISEIEKWS
ncbi:hypothetical protein [Flavobacterium nitratireducens]|uniref:hypothetical protein n=1 Tax=Flavobacterium nitratireducens TaxID=992289 RepID=UPI002415345D|nr:hypothetical protein [Flavobacterium nitratireducens]